VSNPSYPILPNFEFCPALPYVGKRMFKRPATVFRRVMWALFVREMKTRFGTTPISVIGAIIEPVLTWLTFVVLYTIVGREGFGDIPMSWFLLAGIFSWTSMKNVMNKVSYAINVNAHLLNYSLLKPLDFMLARFLLEIFVFIIAVAIMTAILFLMGDIIVIHKPLELVGAYALFFCLGFAMGTLQLFGEIFFKFAHMVFSILMRFLFFTSGVFFSYYSLPPQLRPIALMNPFFQFMEGFRTLYFAEYPEVPINWMFLAAISIGGFVISCLAVKLNENLILSRLKQRQ
jgi:capsular polysaccharide transport system permease protein